MPEAVDRELLQIGTIAQVHGPVVDVACSALPPLHQALITRMDHETYTFEVHQHLDEAPVRAITLHLHCGPPPGHAGVRHGSVATRTGVT